MPTEGAFKLDGIDAKGFLGELEPADQASAVVLIALPVSVLERAAADWADGDEQAQRIHSAILGVRGVEAPNSASPANGG